MLICPNQNTPEYKSWENAGLTKEQIYTEYVLNNYALPMYSQNINKALTIPEIKNTISQFSSLAELGVKDISSLQHEGVNAVGAYFKDVLYFSSKANQKTISEELGHAILQKFANPSTYKLVMEAGKKLLESRLQAEGRTLKDYTKSIQEELGVSESKAEAYAQEEEFMKDYALYDTTGTEAQDLRKINEIAEKLSFLGPVATKIAKAWVSLIKGLKQLLGKKDELTHALELIRSLKQNSQAKYHRGYNVPSFMHIPIGEGSTSVSPFSYQRVVNDVAATYYNRHKDTNNFEERVEEIFEDFAQYYDEKSDINPNDNELINLLYASTALEINRDTVDDLGNAKLSTREETLRNVISALKTMGVGINEDVLEESEFDINESELGGHQSWDTAANQMGAESLSLGLKNIILRVGKKEKMSDGKILTFAPDVSHIYSGLVRYSSKAYNTTDRFKRMVEFSDIPGNTSSKLLIQDYYLEAFKTKAKYKNNTISEVKDWVKTINSPDFVFEDLTILDPILGQEFITLVKGLELVSRDMRTMQIFLGTEIASFTFFDTNSNGIVRKLNSEYADKVRLNFVEKLKGSPEQFNSFFEKNKTNNVRGVLLSMLADSGIFVSPKVSLEILENEDFGERTNLKTIRNTIEDAITKNKPLLSSDRGTSEGFGSLNTLIQQVIDLQVEYDETILENSFTNMDGKTIYAFQRQTPIILTLRNLANTDFLNKFQEGSPYTGQNNMWSAPGFKDNYIVEAFLNLSESERKIAAQTFSLDGLYSLNNEGYREQVSFSDMDDRHFAASVLNLMVATTNSLDKKLKKDFTAVTLGHNEASSLIDFNNVPVLSEEEIDNKLNSLITQELDRINLVKSQIEIFIKDTDATIEENSVEVTYDKLKEYYREKNIPVYKGMLDGKYVIDENGNIDVLNSKVKSFQVSKNLNGIITLEDILAGNSDKAKENLEKILDSQIEDLKDMNVLEILDKAIVNFSDLNPEQLKSNSASIRAFGLTANANSNIKKLLKQFWIGSTFSNQILVGDASISFKNDFKDILKRHRSYNAALLGVDVPFAVPYLNIFPKSEVKMILTESDTTKVYDNKIDKDDAQSYSSLDFWLYKQFSKARLTENSYEVFLDLQAGIPVTNRKVEEAGAYFSSDKTITAQGNQIIKHSEHHLLPSDVAQIIPVSLEEAEAYGYEMNGVSRKLEANLGQSSPFIYVGRLTEKGEVVVNKLVPMEHTLELFNLYAMLQGYSYAGGWNYSGPIDIKSPTTASKGAQKNVLNRKNIIEEFSKNPAYYTQSLSANTYGDQVENPQGKEHVIDASQNQEIKINEIENAKELVEDYLKNHAQRNDFEIDLVMKELYGPNYSSSAELDARQFLDALTRLLKDSGTDNQKLDFFSYKQIGDKFVANYNLNLPPIRQKFTQSLFKMFTNALRHKVAGNSLVQVSSSDYNLVKRLKIVKDVTVTLPDGTKSKKDIPTWDVVSYDEYINDTNKHLVDVTGLKYNGKNLVDGTTDELTNTLLENQSANSDKVVYFFDEVRFMKPYINEANELEFFVSESIMPTWFDTLEDIPESLKLQYGVRIPSQDKQTSVAIEWVKAFGPEKGNSIIVPKEIIFISGSDFDIDKLFTQRPEGYFEKGEFKLYSDNIDDFRKYMFTEKKFFKGLLKEDEEYIQVSKDLKKAFARKEADYRNLVNNRKELRKSIEQNLDLQIESLKEVITEGDKSKIESARKAQSILKNVSKLEKRVNYFDSVLNRSTNFNQEIFELEEKRLDALEKINNGYTELFNLYSKIGFNDRFKNNKDILDENKRLIEESSDFSRQNKEIQDLQKLKEDTTLKVQNKILEKYNYPTTAASYIGQTYPAILNNKQLKNSLKLLSEPEIVYSGIYETPATVEPYKTIFEKFVVEVPKKSTSAKNYAKQDFFSEEKDDTIIFYPFKTKKGESIFTKDPKNIQLFSLLNFSIYQKAVQAAKAGIGLLANANVLGIFAKKLNMRLLTPIIFEGKGINDFQFKTEKNRRVFDAISTTISVTTDEAKESQLSNHGISSNDLKVMSILMLHGFDIEDAFAMTRSQGAKEYNNLLSRQKITRNKVFKSNADLIASYAPSIKVKDLKMTREEFIKTEDAYMSKKYFVLYDKFLNMYGELSKLLPSVKLKTGLANDVPGFMRAMKDIEESNNAEDNFNYYSIGKKSIDFNNSVDVYNKVYSVATKELVEMNPVFKGIQDKLESSITSKKRDYSENILKYIDQFLLGTYARRLSSTQDLFKDKETFKKDLLAKIEDIFSKTIPETDPLHKALGVSKDYLRRIIKIKGGDIKLNFEGKLNQKLKDLISDSWLLLKNSPIQEIREIADDLFKYYFLADALQYAPGSLEIAFPASKFRDISEVYDNIIGTQEKGLADEFITYFAHLPETSVHLKNSRNLLEAFNVEDAEALAKKAKVVFEIVKADNGQNVKVLKAIQMNPNLKTLSRAIKVDHTVYLLAPNKAYYPIRGQLTNDFNTLLTGSNKISEFHKTLNSKEIAEVEFPSTKKVEKNPSKSPQTKEKEISSIEEIKGEEISSTSDNLAFALTNPTFTSPKGFNWSRTWTPGQDKWRDYMKEGIKFEGVQYKDVEEAYQKNKSRYSFKADLFGTKTTDDLMLELLKIKLQTYPKLIEGIRSKGGVEYLEKSTHQPTSKNSHWETKGDNAFIKLLTQAYIEVSAKNNSITIDAKEFTNYSGGAQGGDTIWESIGKEFGIGKQVNYRPETLQNLNSEQLKEVENAYQNAVKDLGRKPLDANSFAGGLVRRDYLQAKAADAIFAISTIVSPGETDPKGYVNKTNNYVIAGGTGYAVQMGINLGKFVYVFDQNQNQWYEAKYLSADEGGYFYGFEQTVTPKLTVKFAGIGTREINELGKQAIRDVYERTFLNSNNFEEYSNIQSTKEKITKEEFEALTEAEQLMLIEQLKNC